MRSRSARVVEHGAELRHFLINLELGIVRLYFVMDLHALALFRLPGTSADHDERRLLGIGACDRVEQIEAAGPVRDDADAESVRYAGGAVGGEADGGLMAERDQLKSTVLGERFVQIENEVSGDAEDVPHTLGVDLIEQNLVELHADDYRT